jgi:hypothetical protein
VNKSFVGCANTHVATAAAGFAAMTADRTIEVQRLANWFPRRQLDVIGAA